MTSSDNSPICLLYTHFHPVVPALLNCCAGPDWGILFTCHLYKAIDEKIMVTAVLMMDSKVARLVFFFHSQYLPSLNTNYLAINKDMELRLPQLYYTKMKNCCNQCYILTSAPVSLNIGSAKLKHRINELKTYISLLVVIIIIS